MFKGFSEELTKQIHTVQEGQRGNNIDHKLAAKKLDQEWADKQEIAVRTALLMEREIAEKRRQEAIKIRLENEKLALEERQRKKNSHLQAFSNTPQQSYFDQFNSTSR